MNIDFEELEKQRKKEILKSGRYCSAEVTVGKNEHTPIMKIIVQQVGSGEVAQLMCAMKEAIVGLAKKDPLAYYIFQNTKTETYYIEKDDIDKHIPRID